MKDNVVWEKDCQICRWLDYHETLWRVESWRKVETTGWFLALALCLTLDIEASFVSFSLAETDICVEQTKDEERIGTRESRGMRDKPWSRWLIRFASKCNRVCRSALGPARPGAVCPTMLKSRLPLRPQLSATGEPTGATCRSMASCLWLVEPGTAPLYAPQPLQGPARGLIP